MKDRGYDVLNYKDVEFKEKFEEKTLGLIDVSFDHVDGQVLDLALAVSELRGSPWKLIMPFLRKLLVQIKEDESI